MNNNLKKILFVGTSLIVLSFLFIEVSTAIDPYLIKPISINSINENNLPGYSLDNKTKILKVISKNPVAIVSDPSIRFNYEVVWIVPLSISISNNEFKEYSFQLSEATSMFDVQEIGSIIPSHISDIANQSNWESSTPVNNSIKN